MLWYAIETHVLLDLLHLLGAAVRELTDLTARVNMGLTDLSFFVLALTVGFGWFKELMEFLRNWICDILDSECTTTEQ